METIKTNVNIPNDRNLVINLQVPCSIPTGQADVTLVFQSRPERKPKDTRLMGAFKGKIKIAEDFDKPLDDDFWLGTSNEVST